MAIGSQTLGTAQNDQSGMTIENVIPGLLYKTNDVGKAEAVRTYIAETLDTDDILFKMSGPMVESILIQNRNCSTVASALGNLTLTPKTGPPMVINLDTFLRAEAKSCRLYMSILVFSGVDDQLVIG